MATQHRATQCDDKGPSSWRGYKQYVYVYCLFVRVLQELRSQKCGPCASCGKDEPMSKDQALQQVSSRAIYILFVGGGRRGRGGVVCLCGVCVLCVYKFVRASAQVWKRGVCARTCVSRVRVHLHMCADAESLSVLVNYWRGRRYTVVHFKAIALLRKAEKYMNAPILIHFFSHLAHFE
jgi:hypothetical protein